MKVSIYLLLCTVPVCTLQAGPFSEFAVTEDIRCQAPDLDEFGNLVWQQWYGAGASGDWDIYRMDLESTDAASLVVGWTGNQTAPAVFAEWVVFEDEYAADDHDVYVKDTSSDLEPNALAATEQDERAPAIHGHTAAWQRLYVDPDTSESDWDIIAADFTDTAAPLVYNAASFTANQQAPAIWRTTVVWQDDYYGDADISSADTWLKESPVEYPVSMTTQEQTQAAVWKNTVVWVEDFGGGDTDILAADMSDPENPEVFFITEHPAVQINPDIHEHVVVWQDNRNGNLDIYGYNLITRREFQITDDPANQTTPTIGGGWVAWADLRTGVRSIWAARLEGTDAAATCAAPAAGDVDGDCRLDLTDLLEISRNWMACGLEPLSACTD